MDADPDPDPAGNLWLQILLLAVLIFVNAFFAASEIAVISLNDTKIRKMAEEGHKKAKQILKLTADSSNFLATIQIGVTMAGFLTSATAAQSLAQPLAAWLVRTLPALQAHQSFIGGFSTFFITLVMGYFNLVLGELVPKRIAMQKPEAIAFGGIGVLRAVSVAMRPFVRFLSFSTNLLVRVAGLDPHASEENVTEEEIRMMVDVGGEKGVIEDVQKEMINNIFEFDDISAMDIMTPRTDVEALDVEDGLAEALRLGVDSGHSRIPVYEEDIDNIIGLLYVKDLLPYVGREVPRDVTVRHLLREAYFVPETKRCGDLLHEMTERRIQMAMVVDEYGGLSGIVTMEDLLESIVGNIQDEYDHEEEEVTRTGEDTLEVDGSINIEELGDLLNVQFPEGEYETIAGFIMERLGRIPGQNEHPEVRFENLLFTVLRVEDRRIERVHIRVEPKPEPEEAGDEAGGKRDRDKDKDKDKDKDEPPED